MGLQPGTVAPEPCAAFSASTNPNVKEPFIFCVLAAACVRGVTHAHRHHHDGLA